MTSLVRTIECSENWLAELWSFKLRKQETENYPLVTERELELRMLLDDCASALINSDRKDILEIPKEDVDDSTKSWLIDLAVKSGIKIAEENKQELYKIKVIDTINRCKDLKLDAKSSDEFVKKTVTILNNVISGDMEKSLDYLRALKISKFHLDYVRYFAFLDSRMNLEMCAHLYKESGSQYFPFLSERTVKNVEIEYLEYLDNYSDDELSLIAMRGLISELLRRATKVDNFDSLVNFTKETVELYEKYGIQIPDLKYLNWTLGQCREVVLCRK